MAVKKKKSKKIPIHTTIVAKLKQSFGKIQTNIKAYLGRRPHRSFRRTRRRDYTRSLQLPGYWAFSSYVRKTLMQHKRTFLLLGLVYAIFTGVLVGIASQDTYTAISDTLRQTGPELLQGGFDTLGTAGLLLTTALTGSISQTLTEVQQLYAALIGILAWLTTVWLLRNILAGHKVKLRDGLYNASAPLLSTVMVALVFIVQLFPLALAFIGYAAAQASGLLAGGVEAMLFWIAASLLALLSLYWITSTFIALIVVTLPGMYPMRALKTAGDIVIGRRVRVLLRMLWMLLGIIVTWVIIIVPIVLIDTWLKGMWPVIEWLPIVPVSLLVVGSFSVIWAASYIYLLYRKVVADDADPA